MNILNYARNLELSKYKNESAILENDTTPVQALLLIKSGKDGTGDYAEQWKQVETAAIAGYEAGKTSGSVIVTKGGSTMVTVNWKITNDEVELSVENKAAKTSTDKEAAKTSTDKEAATSTGPVTKSIKDAAQKIWVALVGSEFTEEEEDVYAVFRDDIKTDADLQSLLAYWKSLKIDFVRGGRAEYNRTSLEKTSQVPFFKDRDITADIDVVNLESDFTLEHWLGSLFNASEINEINNHLSHYSSTRFKAL